MLDLNLLDIVFCIIAGYFLIRGLFRGFIVEAAAIVGVILAFVLANKYHGSLTPYIHRYITTSGWGDALAYLLVFLGVMVIATLLGRMLHDILADPKSLLNTISGGLLGLTKGAVVCLILFMLLNTYLPQAEFLKSSYFVPHLQHLTDSLRPFMPEYLDIRQLSLPEQARNGL